VARRLIPWALTAARRAAREGNAARVALIDTVVSRLSVGMTAGEALLLDDLVARSTPLTIDDLIDWHCSLPPLGRRDEPPVPALVAALVRSPAQPL
jgi:hypothetical protein